MRAAQLLADRARPDPPRAPAARRGPSGDARYPPKCGLLGLSAAAKVTAPSGAQVPVQAQPDGSVQVGPLFEPGAHRVLDGSGQRSDALAFAAVLDASETDLTRLRMDDLSRPFGEETVRAAGAGGAERKAPLWTWLIVLAAAFFFFEGVLLRR